MDVDREAVLRVRGGGVEQPPPVVVLDCHPREVRTIGRVGVDLHRVLPRDERHLAVDADRGRFVRGRLDRLAVRRGAGQVDGQPVLPWLDVPEDDRGADRRGRHRVALQQGEGYGRRAGRLDPVAVRGVLVGHGLPEVADGAAVPRGRPAEVPGAGRFPLGAGRSFPCPVGVVGCHLTLPRIGRGSTPREPVVVHSGHRSGERQIRVRVPRTILSR